LALSILECSRQVQDLLQSVTDRFGFNLGQDCQPISKALFGDSSNLVDDRHNGFPSDF
jgi:hypothetical protein